jgi:Pyridoxal-phosphate dependent enzyme
MSDIMDAALHCAGEHSRQPDEMSDITVCVGAVRPLIPVPGGAAMVRRRRQSPRIAARMPWYIRGMTVAPVPDLADVLAARQRIAPYLRPTPLYRYPALDAMTAAGLWVKHENHQPVGAFKVRPGCRGGPPGPYFDEAREYCEQQAAQHRYRYVHSGDEPALIAGVATYTLEILQDRPDTEVIVVPVGGGLLAGGHAGGGRAGHT